MKRVGIDIGSTTVKIAVLDDNNNILFSAYERHYANIQETLRAIMERAYNELGDCDIAPMITGSGGLSISKHLDIPFVQEVVSVATSLKVTLLRPMSPLNLVVRMQKLFTLPMVLSSE